MTLDPGARALRCIALNAALTALLAAPSFAQELPIVSAPNNACANLKGMRLPDVRIDEVADIRQRMYTVCVTRYDQVRRAANW